MFPNKSFGELLEISPKVFLFLKTFNLEFLCIKVWFTDQNYKLLEPEQNPEQNNLETVTIQNDKEEPKGRYVSVKERQKIINNLDINIIV